MMQPQNMGNFGGLDDVKKKKKKKNKKKKKPAADLDDFESDSDSVGCAIKEKNVDRFQRTINGVN